MMYDTKKWYCGTETNKLNGLTLLLILLILWNFYTAFCLIIKIIEPCTITHWYSHNCIGRLSVTDNIQTIYKLRSIIYLKCSALFHLRRNDKIDKIIMHWIIRRSIKYNTQTHVMKTKNVFYNVTVSKSIFIGT